MSITQITNNDSAIIKGIKYVAVGKKGSKPIPKDLSIEITNEIKEGAPTEAQIGTFIGALMIKGFSSDEETIKEAFPKGAFDNSECVIGAIAPNIPQTVKDICIRLLDHQTLPQSEAEEAARFLLDPVEANSAKGLIASILRVRYETREEYTGILNIMNETVKDIYRNTDENQNIIQFAEPFDGVDHSYLITPLIAKHFQEKGYNPVTLTGRNSGPKYGNNVFDIVKALDIKPLKNAEQIKEKSSAYGWYAHQKDLSPAIDHWVDIRREIIKRPFMATLERFLNPLKAKIMVASAFHPGYDEKMIDICKHQGFPGAIIVRNGLEGTIAFPLMRAAKIFCMAKNKDNEYQEFQFDYNAKKELNIEIEKEEKLDNPSVEENVRLISDYANNNETDNRLFDFRIKATCAGLTKAIEWIEKNLQQ